MKGFNYTTEAAFDLPVEQLSDELHTIVANGGHRRVEDGETFAHGRDGRIIWEAYGNVPAQKSGRNASGECPTCGRTGRHRRGCPEVPATKRKQARQSAGNYGSPGNMDLLS